MKTVYRWLAPIFCFAMLVLLASCATTYRPTDSTVGNMSVKDARKVLVKSWMGNSYISDVRITSNRLSVISQGNKYIPVPMFSELPQISAASNRIWLTDKDGKDSELLYLYGNPTLGNPLDRAYERRVADALYVLKQNAIKQKKEVAEYDASFAASLAGYRRKADTNAALPEEANKYKAQAEGAVRDKAFDDAADYYAEALKIVPWWPVGHFNRALVLGETGDYELAKREMNYYLQLVPGAPNARAAQNKIYEWARLDSK